MSKAIADSLRSVRKSEKLRKCKTLLRTALVSMRGKVLSYFTRDIPWDFVENGKIL